MRDVKRYLLLLIFALLGLALQSVWRFTFPYVPYLCPQLLLIIVVFLSFNDISIKGVFAAFFLGLLVDLSSGIALGPWAGAYTVAYTGLALISQGLFADSGLAVMMGSLMSSVVAGITFALLSFGFTGGPSSAILGLGIEAVATAICAPLVFSLFKFIFYRTRLFRVTTGFD